MARSSLTDIPGFSVRFFCQLIYTDYANKAYFDKRSQGGAVRHNFERNPPSYHPYQVWFNLVQWFQRRRFKCDLLSKYA
jgi:hypothetical protein